MGKIRTSLSIREDVFSYGTKIAEELFQDNFSMFVSYLISRYKLNIVTADSAVYCASALQPTVPKVNQDQQFNIVNQQSIDNSNNSSSGNQNATSKSKQNNVSNNSNIKNIMTNIDNYFDQ